MNAKEAINTLAKMQNYDSKENVGALEIAIEALEKQIPTAPVGYNCPRCGESVFLIAEAGIYQIELRLKACGCGQIIDWTGKTR